VTIEKRTVDRLPYLDLAKGLLVVLMVFYHSLNYSSEYYLAFRYLSFLPPSFIFITGLLISVVYPARYGSGDPRISRRLWIRGLKLLLLFTALNIGVQFLQPFPGDALLHLCQHLDEVYLSGGSRIAAFDVLLPIAYLLLLAPTLLWAAFRHSALLPGITVATLILCGVLERNGYSFANLNLLSIGILGMYIGRLKVIRADFIGRYLLLYVVLYLAYFPLALYWGYNYYVQLIGAFIAIALVCGVGVRLGESGWFQRRLIILGQYSLIAYIGQIAILQLLSRLFGRPLPWSPLFFLLFAVTLVSMTLGIEAVRALRRKPLIDRAYKAVFA